MPDSIYILIVAATLVGLCLILLYAHWEAWDDRRRSERLVHRNLQRMGGRR